MVSQILIDEDVMVDSRDVRDDLQDLELVLQSNQPEDSLGLGHLPISLGFSFI